MTTSQSTSSLSARVSLRWIPDPAFENTDTIVLSLSGWYVDLRVDKASGEIDWAMAGERTVESQQPRTVRVLFTRAIDSHNDFELVDLGTFTPLPNGDDLETGSMPRLDLPGAPVREYEEVWRELPFREGPEGPGRGVSWVLEAREEGQGVTGQDGIAVTRTFIARIWGTYVALRQEQTHYGGDSKAVVEGGEVSARRDEWDSTSGWQTKYIIGPDVDKLPTMTTIDTEDEDWSIGSEVVVSGQPYVVRAFERIQQVE